MSEERGERYVAAAGIAAVIAVILLAAVPVAGQAPPAAKTSPAAPAKNWTPTRTAWGDPDLQGVYSNSTIVPLERPADLAGKAELTQEESAKRFQKYRDTLFAKREGDTGFYNEFWWEWGKDTTRTSLIIDPPDGKLPLTPDAQARAKEALRETLPASWEDLNIFDRCITRSLPGAMMPGFYGHYYQILQTPDYVAIRLELIHDVRIIPLGKRPHVPAAIRQWLGDARGHWEGNTLVVETTNLTDKVNAHAATYFGAGADMRLVERFTRVDADTIDYQFTVEAPKTFTRPWTAAIPLRKTTEPIYEYACHEGNYAMKNSLSGARAMERAAKDAPAKKE
jgi:hypothetical protein